MENIPCSWVSRLDTGKMTVFPKLVYRFNAIAIRIPAAFVTEIDNLILKFIRNCKTPRKARTILGKKKKTN